VRLLAGWPLWWLVAICFEHMTGQPGSLGSWVYLRAWLQEWLGFLGEVQLVDSRCEEPGADPVPVGLFKVWRNLPAPSLLPLPSAQPPNLGTDVFRNFFLEVRGIVIWTQGTALPLESHLSLVCSAYSGASILLFAQMELDHDPSISCFPPLLGCQVYTTMLRWGLFCLSWSQTTTSWSQPPR
jgi:hypothetical protein